MISPAPGNSSVICFDPFSKALVTFEGVFTFFFDWALTGDLALAVVLDLALALVGGASLLAGWEFFEHIWECLR